MRSYLLDSVFHGVRNPHSIPCRINSTINPLRKGIVGEVGYEFQTYNERSAVYMNREMEDTSTDL